MESLRTRLADISSGDDGTSEVRIGTSSNRSTDANRAPSDYLRPRGDDAGAVPPPPVARRDGDSGRAGLPRGNNRRHRAASFLHSFHSSRRKKDRLTRSYSMAQVVSPALASYVMKRLSRMTKKRIWGHLKLGSSLWGRSLRWQC